MSDQFIATMGDGPEFEEGDRVFIIDGHFAGSPGIVFGYDERREAYLVTFGGDCRAPFQADSLELADEQLVDEALPDVLDLPDEIEIGDRVIVTFGNFLACVGWVLNDDELSTRVHGRRVVHVDLEDGRSITIATASLMRSPYQDEEDLDARG